MHEVDSEDNSDENFLIYDGEDCEALVEHEMEGIADFGVWVGDGGFFGSKEVSAFVAEGGDFSAFEGCSGEIALGNDMGRGLILVDDHEGWELIDIHLINGVAEGA